MIRANERVSGIVFHFEGSFLMQATVIHGMDTIVCVSPDQQRAVIDSSSERTSASKFGGERDDVPEILQVTNRFNHGNRESG